MLWLREIGLVGTRILLRQTRVDSDFIQTIRAKSCWVGALFIWLVCIHSPVLILFAEEEVVAGEGAGHVALPGDRRFHCGNPIRYQHIRVNVKVFGDGSVKQTHEISQKIWKYFWPDIAKFSPRLGHLSLNGNDGTGRRRLLLGFAFFLLRGSGGVLVVVLLKMFGNIELRHMPSSLLAIWWLLRSKEASPASPRRSGWWWWWWGLWWRWWSSRILILYLICLRHSMSNCYLLTVGVINKILCREFSFLRVENNIVTYLRKWAKVDNLEKFLWPATQLPVVMKFTLRNKFCGAHMMARKVVPPEIFRLDPWWAQWHTFQQKILDHFFLPPKFNFYPLSLPSDSVKRDWEFSNTGAVWV